MGFEIQFLTAISAEHKARKRAADAGACLAVPMLPNFLHSFKHIFVNDGPMGAGKDRLLLSRISPFLLDKLLYEETA